MKLVMLLDGPGAKANHNRIATTLQYNTAGDDQVAPALEQNATQEPLLNKTAASESACILVFGAESSDPANKLTACPMILGY